MLLNFKKIFFILFYLFSIRLYADQISVKQSFWHNLYFDDYSLTADLDRDYLVSSLEFTPNINSRISSNVVLEIPSHNGSKKDFRFFETNVLPPSLKRKYPNIKSYMGIGIENPSHRSSIVLFKNGLYGLLIDENGNSHIKVDKNHRAIITRNGQSSEHPLDNNCEINMQQNNSRDINDDIFWNCVGADEPCYIVGSTLTTYRFAGIMSERVTNEVSDGTVEGGLAWMVSMVNQINLLWIRELSFKLEMVEESDQLIFTDNNPAPDIFQQDPSCHSSGDPKYCELEQVKPYLETVIGPGGDNTPQNNRTWEYGAHFDTRYNGGVAYMPGSTSTNNANYEVFNHEIGHNLGSPHNISIEGGWRCTIGGTVMGSRVRTLEGFSGDQYSSHTIELAMNYRNDPMIYQDIGIWGGDYTNGSNTEETGNIIPEVIVPESGFIIPKETPFFLEGTSSPSNPNYTYSWEQNDASDESFSMNPLDNSLPFFLPGKGPLFSSIDPTPNGFLRYFPAIQSLLDNNYSTEINDYGTILTVEKLPFASREINMRFIVRTNDPYAGSLNHRNLQFFVSGTAGPFRITSQSDSTIWEVGSDETITWDVANTNDPNGVNCQAVDILLSLNGDGNFDFIIVESVPNTGSYTFTIAPTIPTDSTRVMIRASDNIFFDINNGKINIQNANIPSISLSDEMIESSLPNDSLSTISIGITNNGEEGSVLSYQSYTGTDFQFDIGFDDGNLPDDWSTSTNAECDNPGWFISEDASSSYFTIPPGDGYYIATNDDACNSDGSNDMLFTGPIQLPDAHLSLSFLRYFSAGFSQSFHVLISTDNWETSTELLNLGYWEGNDEEWLQETINLNAYAGDVVDIAFHSNDNGNWASGGALDDIRLGVIPTWINSDGSGYTNYMETSQIDISINANGMEPGFYESKVVVQSMTTDEKDTVDLQLTVENVLVGLDQTAIPLVFSLSQNYPNPFNPNTTLDYSLPIAGSVHLAVYDLLGHEIVILVDDYQEPGYKSITWNGIDKFGNDVSTGMYFYKLRSGDFEKVKKMVLLK